MGAHGPTWPWPLSTDWRVQDTCSWSQRISISEEIEVGFFFHLKFFQLWSKLPSLIVLGEALPDGPPKEKFGHPWILFSSKNTLKPNLPCWETSSQASQSSLAFGWVSTPWVINYPIILIYSHTPPSAP